MQVTPVAFSGLQIWGEGSIFDQSSSEPLIINGTPATNSFVGTSGNDIISGGGGNDAINGWSGNDILYGGSGSDTINGGTGSDLVIVSSGNDVMTGGGGGGGVNGIDTVDFSLMKGNLDINLGQHTAYVGSGNHINVDTVSSFEVVVGTVGGTDTVRGDHYANTFVSAGADNTFRGGLGDDTLIGGSGVDTYVITKKDISDGSVKTFQNFTVGQDSVDLSDFMKGHNDASQEFRFEAIQGSDGSQSTMVQAMVNKQWVNVVDLVGVNAHDVGADHHQMSAADLIGHGSVLS